ncbi:hypothetical protein NDI56_16360 [Haloarcula sp. S1CR25-12]|uniref:Uncharacterized protein n=1 Tax=Haloarcula saliterrae TaxID=2950534 RepID=A0ABU2FGW0_9EURY|nr:hypothetical protein [Haloarcula sp. S1CR25-12]MDS0260976.1 hypothetical protein [Haloarcula sp. S1CR25-12]
MAQNSDAPMRRDTIKYGGTPVAGAGLAGCSKILGDGPGTETARRGSYSVTMDPIGTAEFDSVPERWMAWSTDYCDIGFVLGHTDSGRHRHRPDRWTGLPLPDAQTGTTG